MRVAALVLAALFGLCVSETQARPAVPAFSSSIENVRWADLRHSYRAGCPVGPSELRTVAVGRRNWTFAGSDEGGRRAAAIYTLIATAKLNDVDPQAWLADVLARLPDHPAKRIHDLLPWNWRLLKEPVSQAA